MKKEYRSVVITGCSSGIGLAAARQLKQKGWKVFATARKEKDLEFLEKEGFYAVALELAVSESIRQAVQSVLKKTGGTLGALVNNAGFCQAGAIEDIPRKSLKNQFEINVFGLQELTNLLIPVFRKQHYGRIINISSIAGKISLPFNGAYSASKFALEAISDALRVELKGSGIHVSLIEPGPIISSFRANALKNFEETIPVEESTFSKKYKEKILSRKKELQSGQKAPFALGADAVAKKIIHAIESKNPKTRYLITTPARIGSTLRKFLPDRIMDRIMRSRY